MAQKAIGYGMPGVQVDGNDAFAVYRVVSEALERARAGGGPTLIEAHTYRVTDHTTSDDARRYRAEQEVAGVARARPYPAAGPLHEAPGSAGRGQGGRDAGARPTQEVADAVAAFEAFDLPDPEEIFAHVFAEPTPPLVEQQAELARRVALREGRR